MDKVEEPKKIPLNPPLRKGEAVGVPGKNAYKMTYGDENTTFEPLQEISYKVRK